MQQNKLLMYDNLSSAVVDYLRNKILLGEYKEGDRILEAEVARELDISRAPVREGIKELINQGLIKFIPRKGNFVVKLTLSDIKEIFEIRLLLENSIIEIIIKQGKLSESDYQKLTVLVDEMVAITTKETDAIHRALEMNEKDIELHRFLWQKSGSDRRKKILEDLYLQLRVAMLFDTELTNNLEKTARDHYDIVKYLKMGDIENCQKALKDHILIVAGELT